MKITANAQDGILMPMAVVFDAIIDPAKLSGFFIAKASGPLKEGQDIEWTFNDANARLKVHVTKIVNNEQISFDWPASGVPTHVDIKFKYADIGATIISITESGWEMDKDGVDRALEQTAGWTDFICCMKAYLLHGINLREGRDLIK